MILTSWDEPWGIAESLSELEAAALELHVAPPDASLGLIFLKNTHKKKWVILPSFCKIQYLT